MSYGGQAYGASAYGGEVIYQTTLVLVVTESILLGDEIARTLLKSLSDSVGLTGLISSFKVTSKLLTESLVAADVLSRSLSKSLLESLLMTGGRGVTLSRSEQESLEVDELALFSILKVLILTESVVIAEFFSRSISKFFTEAVSVSESIVKNIQKLFVESLLHAEAFIKQLIVIRSFAEVVSLAETYKFTLNGSLLDIWTKADKIVSTWVESGKVSSIWTKRPKQ